MHGHQEQDWTKNKTGRWSFHSYDWGKLDVARPRSRMSSSALSGTISLRRRPMFNPITATDVVVPPIREPSKEAPPSDAEPIHGARRIR